MPMPIHVRNPDGTPYQIQSVVTPSRKLSPEDLYKASIAASRIVNSGKQAAAMKAQEQ